VFLPVVGWECKGERERLLFQGLQVVEQSRGVDGHREAWGEGGKEGRREEEKEGEVLATSQERGNAEGNEFLKCPKDI